MKKPIKVLTAKETLELLNNQWATTADIMKLAFVCQSKANNIRNTITKNIEEKENKKLPKGLIPMCKLQEYLGINITYLKKISKE